MIRLLKAMFVRRVFYKRFEVSCDTAIIANNATCAGLQGWTYKSFHPSANNPGWIMLVFHRTATVIEGVAKNWSTE